ncbi:hypothetical protein [uncultured Pontibacter sp.]|uniref:hypothetical protein n=1 Tax=uncultured Pontibacter sp. TaxID=453356 RepID=UPI00260DC4B3|nr:hypothetical protein [uncultured Pontibacter sp.]
MKKLLTKDYNNCFLDTIGMPESDWENHYHNFIQDNYTNNPLIIEGLVNAVNWGKGILISELNRAGHVSWDEDEQGNKSYHNHLDTQYPTLNYVRLSGFSGRSYYTHIGVWFFSQQIALLGTLNLVLQAWVKVEEYEELLYKSGLLNTETLDRVKQLSKPNFLDIKGIEKKRLALDSIYKSVNDKPEPPKTKENIKTQSTTMAEVLEIKEAAIAETIELFKDKYQYEPDYQTLLSELNSNYDDYGMKHEIDLNVSYIKTGRAKEREKQIHEYLETCQREKGKIIINEGNVVSNCKPPRMALDYYIYSFWELFHTAQLQSFKQPNTQSEKMDKSEEVHAVKLFADLEYQDWRTFEEQESEIAKIKDYTTNKKARVTERDLTLQELEYEEAAINSYTSQVIEAYPYQGMVFKHVPSLNEKHKRLLAESIAGLESLKKITKARLEAKRKQINLEQVQQHHYKTSTTSKTENEPVEGIPYFTPSVANAICEALKPHFKVEHHEDLKTLLKTGKTANNKPLLFINNGNLLADAFNVLFENSFITKCIKKQLKEWIIQNFEYQADGKDVKHFTVPYLDKVMVKNKKNGFNMHSPKYPLPILDSICN